MFGGKMSGPKRTPLYDDHVAAGGRIVEFAGWEMPVQYEGLRQEHEATRNDMGLFDVSHMGEIRVKGPKALEFLEFSTTNLVSKLGAGQAQYSLLPNDQGGLVDDVIVYCIDPNSDYLVCVNAANKDKDWAYFNERNKNFGADLTDESDKWAQIALQGPRAVEALERVFGQKIDFKPFEFKTMSFNGSDVIVARTGYTGEDGAECFVPNAKAAELWKAFLSDGAKPCGLGARDTLRTEMRYPLYGHEINDETNPYMAGLGWVVKPKDKDFFGKEKILADKADLSQKLVGYELLDKGIPREGYKLFDADGREVGFTTSGTMSPTLGKGIGVAYVNKDLSEIGTEFLVEIRTRKVAAKVVKTPFITK
jgi:aminomethyltransferase